MFLSPHQPGHAPRHVPSLDAPFAGLFDGLQFHSLMDPPVTSGFSDSIYPSHPGAGGVWVTRQAYNQSAGQLLTRRHLALQAIQLKLKLLLGEDGALWNPSLHVFIGGELNHVYVDTPRFEKLVKASSTRLSDPSQQSSFIDIDHDCVVIDTSRFFCQDTARPSAQAFHSIIAMNEAPGFAAALVPQDAEAVVLQHCAQRILRDALRDSGATLSRLAEQLLQRMSATRIAQAVLAGSRADALELSAVFADLWEQRLQGDATFPPLAETFAEAA